MLKICSLQILSNNIDWSIFMERVWIVYVSYFFNVPKFITKYLLGNPAGLGLIGEVTHTKKYPPLTSIYLQNKGFIGCLALWGKAPVQF